jgi:hypothetical protein
VAASPAAAGGFLPRLGRDLRAPFTRRGAAVLGAGAALAWIGARAENPDSAVRLLDRSGIDGLSDVGNEFGNGAVVAGLGAGMGRMEDRRHYLSDVIFGAALGLTVGAAGWPARHLAVAPGGVGFRGTF